MAQLDQYFCCRNREALARPDKKRDSLPAPRVDLESERHKGFHLRVCADARLITVAAKLTAYNIARLKRTNAFEHFCLLIPQHLGIEAGGRLHGDVRKNLQQMVLHDIAHGARLIVKLATPLDAEIFRHSDLHAFNELPIPQRLKKRICKAEEEQVLNRVFTQVMVDAKHVFFIETTVYHGVQHSSRAEVVSERLLDDDARAHSTTRCAELVNDDLEKARWDGKIVQRMLCVGQFPPEQLKRCRIGIVAINVAQAPA